MSEPIYSPGLEGVIAGETAISTIEGGLRYRGYPVGELVENASFDEVAYLLLHGELPNRVQLASFQRRVAAARSLPHPLLDLLRVLPPAVHPMDVVRTAVSVLAHYDPDTEDELPRRQPAQGRAAAGADPGGGGRPIPPEPRAGSRARAGRPGPRGQLPLHAARPGAAAGRRRGPWTCR